MEKNPSQFWLMCETSNGLFSGEVVAESQTITGQSFSLFADRTSLEHPERNGRNYLRVYAEPSGHDKFNVILPAAPFETGRVVEVHSSQMKELTH